MLTALAPPGMQAAARAPATRRRHSSQQQRCRCSAASGAAPPAAVPSVSSSTCPTVVVGPGRIGRALASFCTARSRTPTKLVGRGEPVPNTQGPVLVATRTDAVEDVIRRTPKEARPNLVFFQNGYFQPVLEEHNLAQNTQLLVYMSATDEGEVEDGMESVVCGRWAEETAAVLHAGDVACRVAQPAEFAQLQAKKLLWAAIFWAMCHGLGGATVGQVAQHHREEVQELVAELYPLALDLFQAPAQSTVAGAVEALPGDAGDVPSVADVTDDLCTYSLLIPSVVPSWDMAIAEFRWRNAPLLDHDATPAHVAWLERAGCPADLLQ